jgi:hypothetical protein
VLGGSLHGDPPFYLQHFIEMKIEKEAGGFWGNILVFVAIMALLIECGILFFHL